MQLLLAILQEVGKGDWGLVVGGLPAEPNTRVTRSLNVKLHEGLHGTLGPVVVEEQDDPRVAAVAVAAKVVELLDAINCPGFVDVARGEQDEAEGLVSLQLCVWDAQFEVLGV